MIEVRGFNPSKVFKLLFRALGGISHRLYLRASEPSSLFYSDCVAGGLVGGYLDVPQRTKGLDFADYLIKGFVFQEEHLRDVLRREESKELLAGDT